VFTEIIIFFSNLIMNVMILLVASCFNVKKLRQRREKPKNPVIPPPAPVNQGAED
jgi:hypothetical protein